MTYNVIPRLEALSPRRSNVLYAVLFRRSGQLLIALILGALVPVIFRFGLEATLDLPSDLGRLLSGRHIQGDHLLAISINALGVLLTHLLFHQFSPYPGKDALSQSLPACVLGFGLAVLIITLGQLDFSRFLLLSGFICTLCWYSLVNILQGRLLRPRLLLAPAGNAHELTALKEADWVVASKPDSLSQARQCDGVVVDLSADIAPEWAQFIVGCANDGIAIFDSTRTKETLKGEIELQHLGDIGIDTLLPRRGYLDIKSAIDFSIAIAVLPIVLPVLAVTAVAIKLDSPGSVFFVQERVGYRGHVFRCYKLRSMTSNAELSGPSFTTAFDPRVTRIGRFIRKFRIDELPQIFNILKGEMSWIGPRPEAVPLSREYERHINFYAFRHAVKPGISGWAAIRQGNVAEVAAATEKLRQDFFYIKNLSASLDLYIACRTVWIMVTGFGSK